MEKIEYSTDGGETWTEVMYESVNGTLSTYESFQFQFKVNTNSLPSGYNMVIVRGVDSEGSSSMIDWDTVLGGGNLVTLGDGDSLGRTLYRNGWASNNCIRSICGNPSKWRRTTSIGSDFREV